MHPPGFEDPEVAIAGSFKIARQMAEALSSTAQDVNRGKRTEIDSLNGYISRRGVEFGVPTPVNHALYTLVKLAQPTATISPAPATSYLNNARTVSSPLRPLAPS